MFRRIMGLFAFCAFLMLASQSAKACGQCEYKDDFGVCWPKGGCLIPNPGPILTAPITLAKALASGNPEDIKAALGNSLVNSASCFGCNYLATKIAPNLSEEQRNRIIGEGFLTFLATGDPVLVVVDIGTNLATQHPVVSDTGLPTAPAPPTRGSKIYTGTPACILSKGPQIFATWTDAPTLKDVAANQDSTFPVIDLMAGDTLSVTAARICSEWEDPATGTIALSSSNIRYQRASIIPGGPSQMKYFFIGTQAPAIPTASK